MFKRCQSTVCISYFLSCCSSRLEQPTLLLSGTARLIASLIICLPMSLFLTSPENLVLHAIFHILIIIFRTWNSLLSTPDSKCIISCLIITIIMVVPGWGLADVYWNPIDTSPKSFMSFMQKMFCAKFALFVEQHLVSSIGRVFLVVSLLVTFCQ